MGSTLLRCAACLACALFFPTLLFVALCYVLGVTDKLSRSKRRPHRTRARKHPAKHGAPARVRVAAPDDVDHLTCTRRARINGSSTHACPRWTYEDQTFLSRRGKLTGAQAVVPFPSRGYMKPWRRKVISEVKQRCTTRQRQAAVAIAQPSTHRLCTGHIFEFGVYTGRALREMAIDLDEMLAMPAAQRSAADLLSVDSIWGFDSFEGLPRAVPSSERRRSGVGYGFDPGDFSVASLLAAADCIGKCHFAADVCLTCARNASSPNQVVQRYIGSKRVELVVGHFSQTLTPTLARERRMRPAILLDLDVDVLGSARIALDWAFSSGLIVPGSILGFDDWGYGLTLHDTRRPNTTLRLAEVVKLAQRELTAAPDLDRLPEWSDSPILRHIRVEPTGGEPRAHQEVTAKYSVALEPVSGALPARFGPLAGLFGPTWSAAAFTGDRLPLPPCPLALAPYGVLYGYLLR
jgi:hypothetical protein